MFTDRKNHLVGIAALVVLGLTLSWDSALASHQRSHSKQITRHGKKQAKRRMASIGNPHSTRAQLKRAIQKKYAQMARDLKDKQVREDDRLAHQLMTESSRGLRMERLRALDIKHKQQLEALNRRSDREMCSLVNERCAAAATYSAIDHGDQHIPTYAQDSGFVYE